MCTRMVNIANPEYPITFRNMDWPKRVNTHFFYFTAGVDKQGFDSHYLYLKRAQRHDLEPFEWRSQYASIVAMFGDEKRGFATADGQNEKGLTVNVLADKASRVKFGQTEHKLALSPLRWGQYLLDCFKSVEEVVAALEDAPYTLIPDRVPDNQIPSALVQAKAIFKVCVSDSSGNAALIQYLDGQFVVSSREDGLIISDQGEEEVAAMHQQFQQLLPAPTHQVAFEQTQQLSSACALPLKPSSLKDLVSNSTTSTFYSSPAKGRYYFIDAYTQAILSLSFDELASWKKCAHIQLVKTPKNQIDVVALSQQKLAEQLVAIDDPFRISYSDASLSLVNV